MSKAVVALVQYPDEEIVAVRFPCIDDVHRWEDKNPDVFVLSTARLVTQGEAKEAS